MPISAEERKKIKGEGFLSNSDGAHFSARIITENGVLTAQQMEKVCKAAKKFGNGEITFTVRLSIELPGVPFENIPQLKDFIAEAGLQIGGTGPKIRPIVACKGTYCSNGLIDTFSLAKAIHERFFLGYKQVILPHKFKITVGGCPNNCAKPDLNDVGIVGQSVVNYDESKCRGCDKCGVMQVCPMQAASVENKKMKINKAICINCGKCINKCYFGAIPDSNIGYRIYIGGRWGKKTRHGSLINKVFSLTEAMDVVEKSILMFIKEGLKSERFGSTIDRIGIDNVESMLISDILLQEKREILDAN